MSIETENPPETPNIWVCPDPRHNQRYNDPGNCQVALAQQYLCPSHGEVTPMQSAGGKYNHSLKYHSDCNEFIRLTIIYCNKPLKPLQ